MCFGGLASVLLADDSCPPGAAGSPGEGALGRPACACVPSEASCAGEGLVRDAFRVAVGVWRLSGDAFQKPQRTGAIWERCTRTLIDVKAAYNRNGVVAFGACYVMPDKPHSTQMVSSANGDVLLCQHQGDPLLTAQRVNIASP